MSIDFPRFVVFASLDETPTKLFLFLIEKFLSRRINPKTVKKLRNSNLLVEKENGKHTESTMKMKNFQ